MSWTKCGGVREEERHRRVLVTTRRPREEERQDPSSLSRERGTERAKQRTIGATELGAQDSIEKREDRNKKMHPHLRVKAMVPDHASTDRCNSEAQVLGGLPTPDHHLANRVYHPAAINPSLRPKNPEPQ